MKGEEKGEERRNREGFSFALRWVQVRWLQNEFFVEHIPTMRRDGEMSAEK
jgi:hypothetical protein